MRPRTRLLFAATLFALLVPTPAALAQFDKLSPFEAVRYADGAPQVMFDGAWYEPLRIDGHSIVDIMDYCRATWPDKAEKRFAEDLVEVLTGIGGKAPARARCALRVRPLDGGASVTVLAEMTEDNRQAILAASNPGDPRGAPARIPEELTTEQVRVDLDALRRAIDEDFAYRDMRGNDVETDPVWTVPDAPVRTFEHAERIQAFIDRFGDGHAGVRSRPRDPEERAVPILFFDAEKGVVAVHPDQIDLVTPGYPYVKSIDDVPVERWIEAAAAHVTRGSPQLVRHRAVRALRSPTRLRRALGLETGHALRIAMATEDLTNELHITIQPGEWRPKYDLWPLRDSGVLDGNIGYLRIGSMDDALIGRIHQTMWSFRDTNGLIIDVRGNGGGSRGILRSLWGYLMADGDAPTVANIAKYRLSPRFEVDHLEIRGLFRADDERWGDRHRKAIARAAAAFEPEWEPDPAAFSPWHYLVLDRTGDVREYHYDEPVVVLMDTSCFSATDIFLGAMALHPNVTLVGRPSSGGSARSVTHVLPGSGLRIRLASMASFRPDGRLYDGAGIEVDVDVAPTPGFFIGTEDPALDRALDLLQDKR